MSKKPGYENTVMCPYNKCHVVLNGRYQIHLSKCAKQHPHIRLETCPYDVMHKFRAEEIDAHIENCPSHENFLLKAAEEQAIQMQQFGPRITMYDKDKEQATQSQQLDPRITTFDKDYDKLAALHTPYYNEQFEEATAQPQHVVQHPPYYDEYYEEPAAQPQQLALNTTYYDEDCEEAATHPQQLALNTTHYDEDCD